MIVVDAVRFPYIEGTGRSWRPAVPRGTAKVPDTNTANTVYSSNASSPIAAATPCPTMGRRPQSAPRIRPPPLRRRSTPTLATPSRSSSPDRRRAGPHTRHSRGYYVDNSGSPRFTRLDRRGAREPGTTTPRHFHTLGWANEQTENWDFFPFHDRDFTSVAELTLVPGCPPGLFTKQFVDAAPVIGFRQQHPH